MAEQISLHEFLALLERMGLSDATAGALIGIAAHTVTRVRLSKEWPHRADSCARIKRFVEVNRDARERSDVRLTG